ncbi:SRPBCC family protein [Nocardia terpenica]|uniref:SRPBCC domain-containing protein n=1 Tax=Nocardia terpenica TaxID=455432 RepID=A0A6G9ZC89_9NOCA|nr:SRPBCC domain-containing protein [Nocardia terpenica]QIS22623.1 SRPBCC domain-containing protein [Nocardia terpenica]
MPKNFEIRKEVVLEATPEQVWQAIATAEGLAAWAPPPHERPEGAGVEREEPKRLSVRTPELPNGAFHAFEFLLEARDGGTTVLRFVHSGFLGDDWDSEYSFEELTGRGWNMYLHTLFEYLKYFSGRTATYVEAQAPAAGAATEAWSTLQQGLGLTGTVRLGERVRLTPEGLPPIEGVVDYAELPGNFLAVRTDDGLYRFHNLTVMDMPIAVGHHIFADIDREVTARAWKDWLDRLFT